MRILYVTANPKLEEQSFSLQVGRALINAIKALPDVEVSERDLFQHPVPEIDHDVMAAWGALQQGKSFTELTVEQQTKVGGMNATLESFLAADCLVFATPMWNYGYPPRFKAFIDSLLVAGRTFKYTDKGPVGLVSGKKVINIIASGGIYSHGPRNDLTFSDKHVRNVLGMIGLTEFETIWVEGVNMGTPEQAENIKQAAIVKALKLVDNFIRIG